MLENGYVTPKLSAYMDTDIVVQRILVRCKQSSINLPVTPETTPIDLAYSSANILSQGVTPSAAILLESYTQLGLERRIRRYEHVRDIMNSWDRDTQNALILEASDSPGFDYDLDASSVPKECPEDTMVYMYHSQKRGKWNKRHITLLSTGQIFLSKKQGAKITDKDSLSICHLSDFDIYTPTLQQLRKVLRPPKKHCYAIKSQQRTTMFLNTENYVHFFNTDDQKVADKWYNAVQQWRSWYLVNKKGEGQKSDVKQQVTSKASAPNHKVAAPEKALPYTIGTFSPLIDDSRLNNASPPINEDDDENRPRQIPFHLRNSYIEPVSQSRERHPPPVSYKLPGSNDEPLDGEFAPTGLLGRTYSQRQRAQKERQIFGQDNSGPFTGGLLNSVDTSRPQTSSNHGRDRAKSVRRPNTANPHNAGKTLVDLTPKVEEPAFWRHRGHGVLPPAGVPLVDVANTPDEVSQDYQLAQKYAEGKDFPKGSLLEKR
jgi:hypothetical protein